MAYSPVTSAKALRVYVETTPVIGEDGWRKYDGGGSAVGWVLRPELHPLSISLTSGPTPSTAQLQQIAADAGPLHVEGPFVAGVGLDANGDPEGEIVKPSACGMMDQVKIVEVTPAGGGEPESETVLFIGIVTEIIPDWKAGTARIVCSDFRWLFPRTPVIGGTFWYQIGEEQAHEFLLACLPVFNARGLPDKYNGADVEDWPASFTGPGRSNAAYWTRGDIWNWLRYHFNTNVPVGEGEEEHEVLCSTAHYLDWPEVVAAYYGELLDAANVWPDFMTGGHGLDKVLNQLVRKRGGHDWWLRPNQTGEKAALELFGTSPDTVDTARQTLFALARGTPGQNVEEAQPDVLGGSPAWNADRVFLSVRGLGARKRYDLTFDTVAGTLEKGWTPAEQAAWLALSNFERRRQYKNVFCRWVIPTEIDWADKFGWAINILRNRPVSPLLWTTALGPNGQPVRLRAQAWRKISGGDWEAMPTGHGECSPFPGGAGVHLADQVREKLWTWNADEGSPAAWDLRITVAIEADERLQSSPRTLEGTGWPRLECLILDEAAVYAARREAWMNATAGVPVLDGGTAALFGEGDDDAIQNGVTRLTSPAEVLLSQLARLGREGHIQISRIRSELTPGCVLTEVTGGGTRPTEPFNVVIRKVVFAFGDKPTTTVHVEAD